MLSIAEPIKIKVLLHQFSFLMLNLRCIFLFTVYLPDRAALQAFGKCRAIISPRGPKGVKRENKKINQDASGMLFTLYESFVWQIFASLSLFTFARIACLLQL